MHTASAMGEVASENICGLEAHYCEKTNPTCAYMEPEAASVGLTEEQCKAQGIAYKVGKFPMSANGKALILNGGEGLGKIIAGAEYSRREEKCNEISFWCGWRAFRRSAPPRAWSR